MQKLTYLLVLSSFCSAAALAAYTGPGAENRVSTASQVEQANDDTQVELTGYLVKSLGDETYLFRDDSGEVKVEIDHDLWRNINADVKESTLVKLTGEVDTEWNGKEVEIESITLVGETAK
ncbi:NirD/YgiW/YdeI family stress tolerance protein [Shewanella algae]|uniref:NirD/YgiW/YdeI family stress tolerance protein n=1 Tax=Shewanella algae TaxID=38313 RepID=UPI000BB611E5|nr:NirD/YgiW/YdeI family stress tolerance protein [Shewanella algae]MBO2580039.1 NirD/YgiW/YdeI family stress tolerance protein [Shewanella algae]MBO2681276.1 NirD/YgiW/YdeI family stress tolerance protein [Shewanella algae]MBO2685666.1 NirD/YgiW/YdeI family stress tolerance protein [Shewanella algae]PBQ26694.1 hypothetical protein AYI97_13855 [Shewanella algae]PSS68399.1 hypothetical protein AYI85_14575 [Shewanella algae]